MDSKDLRKFVISKFEDKKIGFKKLKDELENFCISILIDCKSVLVELDSAKKVFEIIVDEIDDRTNTGIFDPLDGPIIKGLFAKFADTPQLEAWFLMIRNKALDIITKETQDASGKSTVN